jgi:hypothetical protein
MDQGLWGYFVTEIPSDVIFRPYSNTLYDPCLIAFQPARPLHSLYQRQPEIRDLFGNFRIDEVSTNYLTGGADRKKKVTELLIRNY